MRNESVKYKLHSKGNLKIKRYINQFILIYKNIMYISALRAQLIEVKTLQEERFSFIPNPFLHFE